MFVSALIAAAGRGSRVGGGTPKQFLQLAGKTMLERSVEALAASPLVSEIVVAVPPDGVTRELPSSPSCRVPVRLIPGGEHRQESVANALRAADPRAELLLIHDAARPFVTANLIAQTIEAARRTGAAIAAIRATDTVKHALTAEPEGPPLVRQTLPRGELWLAQTPQVFRRELLSRALAQRSPDHPATDEASLVEAIGHNVEIVEGDAGNVKITSLADLQAAEARFAASAGQLRVGVGYDLHRLVPGRALVLAGVTIPFDRGLDGHSDADIVCHAITDAVLGAAALGDIGRLFPDTDPQWKDADSLGLLAAAVARVTAQGFGIDNVDATVIAEAPKLLPHLEAMRHNLAGALGCDASAVSVKGKTNEGVDSMGRGESMACHAVALLTARASQ